MANAKFDFENFQSQYNLAMAGLQDTMKAVRDIIPHVQEVARQTGSAKLTRTSDSFVQVAEETLACFASVETSAEEVQRAYKRLDEAVN